MPSSFDDDEYFFKERPLQKVVRKLKEEPLIPIGTFLTCLAFYRAWRGIRKGDHRQTQRMFRARVAAQAFTVLAMVGGGLYYSNDRRRTKEQRKLMEAQEAEEKRLKWIRELEARDREEKELRESMGRRRREQQKQTTGQVAGTQDPKSKTAAMSPGMAENIKGSSWEYKWGWSSWLGASSKQNPEPPQDGSKKSSPR